MRKPLVQNAINQPRHYDWFRADDLRSGDVISVNGAGDNGVGPIDQSVIVVDVQRVGLDRTRLTLDIANDEPVKVAK